MKIRTDFVTNSSSSSFIIALKNKPETVEELYDQFYGDQKNGDMDLVRKMFEDIPKKGLTKEELIEIFSEEDWAYRMFGFKESSKMTWEEQEQINREKGTEEVEVFLESKEDSFIYEVEYEDCGDCMEHRIRESGILDDVKHKIFSHH